MNISHFLLTIFKTCMFQVYQNYIGNAKLSLHCIQGELDFIKAAPQQTISTIYNRNRPEMTLTGPQSVTESSQQMATHSYRAYELNNCVSPHIFYKMLSLHWLNASLLQRSVYKGTVLWKNIDHSFCQAFSRCLSHYWVKSAHC